MSPPRAKVATGGTDLFSDSRFAIPHSLRLVAGVDEAGRGPLAGPVTVAAVILDPRRPIDGLNDSKKLSEAKREALYPLIIAQALAWRVEFVEADEIDRLNILQATLTGMRRALEALSPAATFARIDGNRLPNALPCAAEALVGGDAIEPAIMAASIRTACALAALRVRPPQGLPEPAASGCAQGAWPLSGTPAQLRAGARVAAGRSGLTRPIGAPAAFGYATGPTKPAVAGVLTSGRRVRLPRIIGRVRGPASRDQSQRQSPPSRGSPGIACAIAPEGHRGHIARIAFHLATDGRRVFRAIPGDPA
jgi:ribonuclease HII